MRTIIEPFRIKMVEPLKMTTPEQRDDILKAAHFNPFLIPAEDVLIDLLTDSGTSAMSAEQWAGMLRGDESYAGARSWFRFEETMKEVTGMPHILPTHQGRASERILFELLCAQNPAKSGKLTVPNNNHLCTVNRSAILRRQLRGNADENECCEVRENRGERRARRLFVHAVLVTGASEGRQHPPPVE